MRYIMRRSCLFLVMIAVIVFTGCGQKKKEDPVTVTLWHVYGGQTESPLNDLIDEFNETIGKEENIRVQVGSVTNTNTIHENVLASAFGDPGASKLPDMFVSYPKTVKMIIMNEKILSIIRNVRRLVICPCSILFCHCEESFPCF